MTVNKESFVRHSRRMSVALIVFVLLTTVALAAVAGNEIIKNAYGTGVASREKVTYENTDEDGNVISSWSTPSEERVESDPAIAEGYVEQPAVAVSIGMWTWTVDEMLVDENGIGAMTVTVSNPDGIDKGTPVDFVTATGTPTNLYLEAADGTLVDTADYCIEASRTAVSVQQAVYMTPFKPAAGEGEYVLHTFLYEGNDVRTEKAALRQNVKRLPSVDFASDKGITAAVSSVGLMLTAENMDEGYEEIIGNRIVLHFSDGSRYILKDDYENIDNTPCASTECEGGKTYLWMAFNRLVDIDSITAISFEGQFGGSGLVSLELIRA